LEADLPESILDPEPLEEKVKMLDEDVEVFFDQKVVQYVRNIVWNDFFLSDELGGTLPLNHVSIPNIILEIRIVWIEEANTEGVG
jgi:hypothetical protein